MSEKLYVLLLRLYPSQFREAYGHEALMLFRDRVRDERGFIPRLRLWSDLIADLAVSLPREYRNLRPVLAPAGVARYVEGAPSFHLLEGGSPRPEAFCFGAALSIVTMALISILMSSAPGRAIADRSMSRDLRPTRMALSAVNHSEKDSGGSGGGAPGSPAKAGHSGGQSAEQDAVAAAAPNGNSDTVVDPAERQLVIDRAAANLKQYYFDHDVALKTADALLAQEKDGDDATATQGAAFAALLTAQMRQASHDMHLVVEYSLNPLPAGPPVQTAEGLARFREAMLQQRCMIRKAELLPRNIGYLKLDFFPDASICGDEISKAMMSLSHADAVIFDLRDSTGGFPETVSLVASYLFDHPEYMYSPRGAPTVDSWTRSPVAGSALADKPVYVLTSSSTWSGAEQFSYDLKMLKRATLVGETTRGGAHAGVFHRIDDHFGMGIPEERGVDPFGKTDWEGTGVEPDVKVKAADALDTAVRLAEANLPKKH
jgi:Peptidase family S41